jgi:hypothetical protein
MKPVGRTLLSAALPFFLVLAFPFNRAQINADSPVCHATIRRPKRETPADVDDLSGHGAEPFTPSDEIC